jgi:hypothetical protein
MCVHTSANTAAHAHTVAVRCSERNLAIDKRYIALHSYHFAAVLSDKL